MPDLSAVRARRSHDQLRLQRVIVHWALQDRAAGKKNYLAVLDFSFYVFRRLPKLGCSSYMEGPKPHQRQSQDVKPGSQYILQLAKPLPLIAGSKLPL